MLPIVLLAACKADRAPSGSGSAALRVVTTPLPTVASNARLAPASDPVPAHEILIDASGHIAAFAANRRWSGVVLQVETQDPLDLAGLDELANAVHRSRTRTTRTLALKTLPARRPSSST
jgi:hypothetical protein